MLVEGYLPCREAMWMWDEITKSSWLECRSIG